MLFRKKRPWVRFVNAMPGVEFSHPIMRSTNQGYDWFQKSAVDFKNKQEQLNLGEFAVSSSRCPGIHQLFKTGFIIPAPIDFTIETRKDHPGAFKWECPFNAVFDGREYIGAHNPDQLADFMPFRDDTLTSLVKVHTRWRISSSPDIVFLQVPIAYPDHNLFTAAQGIIDTANLLEVNVQLFWHKLDGTHLVKAGTPLCQLIPLPRNFNIDLKIETYTKEDRYKEQAYEFLTSKSWKKDMKKFYESCTRLLKE